MLEMTPTIPPLICNRQGVEILRKFQLPLWNWAFLRVFGNNTSKEDLEMAKINLDGRIWYRCDHLSNAMRKTFGFRMIGKFLYCSPIK
jgi:hypothetical protein